VRTIDCAREQDVVDALASGRWPERVPDDLRRHVDGCDICADTLAVALPLLLDRDAPGDEPHIPSSAVMWWRAQLRARQEAAREAARPIAVAQIVGGVVAALAIAVLALSPLARAWVTGLAGGTHAFTLEALTLHGWLLPALMLLLGLVLTPLAIYFAVVED
jgi:hypothetical protein